MKNMFLATMLVTVLCSANVTEEEKLTVNIVNQNHNHNNHTIDVHPEKKDPFDCTHYYGTDLKMRMADLPKEELSKNLIRFSHNKRHNYLSSLTAPEAQHILSTLDTEERAVLKKSLGAEADKATNVLQATLDKAERQKQIDESFSVIFFRTLLNAYRR